MWDIQLFKLNYDEREKLAVSSVLDSGWLTMGEKTLEFEREFADFLNDEVSCISMSSCTAALHSALLALDVMVTR